MVQILPRPESSGERFAKAFASLGSSLGQDIPQELMGQAERKKLGEMMGEDISDIRSPEHIRQLLGSHLTRKEQSAKLKGEYDAEEKSYTQIKEAFGEKFANVWRAMGQGERTALVQNLLKAQDRGLDIDQFLSGAFEGETPEGLEPNRESQLASGMPDFTRKPKGRTWGEWTKEMEGWGKKNTETLDSARDRLKGNKRDVLGTKKLQQLEGSGKLPEGFGRLLIDPSTGDPYKTAQKAGLVSPEAQEWVKEIARFGNRAKDAFGSRVTNFDLFQYMKQFPSLLNTGEGRQRILRMMEINYELDALYDKAVQQIIDDIGEDKIPPAQVDKMARRLIKDREEQLFNEYLNIESENESSFLREETKKPSLEDIFSG
jgi:hypothetical protein